MSSSFLYLGIVVVWAFWLVPRWLRRQHVAPQVDLDVEVDVEFAAEDDAGAGYADVTVSYENSDDYYPTAAAQRARYLAAPRSRSRVLRARRRLLTMLLLLTAVAAGCTALKVTSWWVCIPPAGLLGGYLLLLREAAIADAEHARRLAAMAWRAEAARQRAYAAAAAYEPEPTAEIIDISARVGDQLYDQYADATARAVGD